MTSAREVLPIVFGVDAMDAANATLVRATDEAVRRGVPLQLVHAVLPVTIPCAGVEETAHHRALRQLGDEALDKAMVRAQSRRDSEGPSYAGQYHPRRWARRADGRAGTHQHRERVEDGHPASGKESSLEPHFNATEW
ncbi:universal stress protein [Streptomyces sp. NPDC054841]